MPRAFTHIAAINFSIVTARLKLLNMPKEAKLAIARNQNHCSHKIRVAVQI